MHRKLKNSQFLEQEQILHSQSLGMEADFSENGWEMGMPTGVGWNPNDGLSFMYFFSEQIKVFSELIDVFSELIGVFGRINVSWLPLLFWCFQYGGGAKQKEWHFISWLKYAGNVGAALLTKIPRYNHDNVFFQFGTKVKTSQELRMLSSVITHTNCSHFEHDCTSKFDQPELI